MSPEDLVQSCLPLARGIAFKFARSYPRLDDEFESDALLALWRAAQQYIPGRSKFTTYASASVRYACLGILDRHRAKKRSLRCVSLNPHDEFDLAATIPAKLPAIGAALEAREILDLLPPDLVAEAELFAEGFAVKDIAAAAGASRQARHDRRRRVAKKMQGLVA